MSQDKEEAKVPTKQDMLNVLNEKLEVISVQLSIQKINTELAELRLKEVESLAKATQFQQQAPNDMVPHIVTQEDLDNNEELKKAGVVVGQQIGVPKEAYEGFLEASKAKKKTGLRKV